MCKTAGAARAGHSSTKLAGLWGATPRRTNPTRPEHPTRWRRPSSGERKSLLIPLPRAPGTSCSATARSFRPLSPATYREIPKSWPTDERSRGAQVQPPAPLFIILRVLSRSYPSCTRRVSSGCPPRLWRLPLASGSKPLMRPHAGM